MANTAAAPQSIAQQVSDFKNYWRFTLGGVILEPFEVPETFDIGHELQLAVHKYISANGQPTIKTESLGSFYVPTSWKGTFYYNTALQRALQFDALMLAGKPVKWIYGPLTYLVIIKKFTISVRHQLQMDYAIELEVIGDSNAQTVAASSALSFDVELEDQYSNAAAAMNNLLNYQSWQKNNPTITIAQGIAPTSIPSISIPLALALAYEVVTNLIQLAFPISQQDYTTIQQVVSAAQVLYNEMQPYLTTLEATAVTEGDLAALTATLEATYNLNLVIENLSQLLGVSPTAITVPNFTGSVFSLAVQYYPATSIDQAAGLIVQANSLNDFYVYVPTTITIPPLFQ